jgi:plastocyanin
MRRTRVPLVVITLLTAGCASGGGYGSGPNSSTPASTPQSSAPTSTGTATASGVALKIASFAYDPTPLTVTAGQQVPVTNADSAEHTVTSDMAGLFAANEIKYGKSVTFTAPKTAGTYTFHCAYHPRMHGTLVVKG